MNVNRLAEIKSETSSFLSALFAGKPDGLYLLLWTLPEKQSHWFQKVEDAMRFAKSRSKRDLYVGVGLCAENPGRNRRCPSHEVSGIVGLWADLDVRSEAHSKVGLPPTVEAATEILPKDLPPTFLVHTGNGVHGWWLFREPLIFGSNADRCNAEDLAFRWQSFLQGRASVRGWSFDRLADLARVLRVPGTSNCKDRSNPKPVIVQWQDNRRYDPSELSEYLAGAAILDIEAGAPRVSAQGFQEKPLAINLSARILESRISQWLESDSRFRRTWFRQRQDLNDQSQSGYDLSLACFGVGAGLSEQEIVDLIVHHRAFHKQKARTRLDYFQRTISTAASQGGLASTFDRVVPLTPDVADVLASGYNNGTDPTFDGIANQTEICCSLSTVLGAKIRRITKIRGQSPIFHMDLEEGKAEFSNVGKLIGQASVRNVLAGVTGKLMPRFRPKEWEKIAQALLDACTVEEGGEEMEMEGSARLRLIQYLTATPFIDSLDGQDHHTARKPMIADDCITVCASDIQSFINKTTAENVSIPVVVGMLSAIGATSKRFRGKYPEQSRWLLPPERFAAAEYIPSTGEERFYGQ